jgi:hypothetical protein
MLAIAPVGCAMSTMLARGFSLEMLEELVRTGSATARRETFGARNTKVVCVRITDTGRRTMTNSQDIASAVYRVLGPAANYDPLSSRRDMGEHMTVPHKFQLGAGASRPHLQLRICPALGRALHLCRDPVGRISW